MTAVEEPAPRAGRREWIALAVLSLPTMLLMLDINVLMLALPQLSEDLGASSTQQLWITDIYGFAIAGFLVTMGTLGDRIGRRRLLLGGAAVFAVVSVVAAFSDSAAMLVVSRAVLGVAGATVMPSTLALISNMFQDPKERGTAIAMWASAMMAGVALGPAVGGLVLAAFWWGSVFLIAVPVMLLVVVTGPALLTESRDPDAGRLDLLSAVLSLATVLPVIYGLKELARSGWDPLAAGAVVLGVIFGALFVQRQRRLADPMLDLGLFADRTLRAGLTVSLVNAVIMGGTGLMVALYLQTIAGHSPLASGLWLLIPACMLVVGVQLSNLLAQRMPPSRVLLGGLLIAAVGQLLITQVDSQDTALLITATTLIYFGASPVGPITTGAIMGAAPPEKAGAASSLSATGGEFGVALGIAGLGSLGTVVYSARVEVPDEAGPADADAAQESIAGALHAAGQLEPGSAGALLDSARTAFTSGVQSVAAVCAVFSLALAVLIGTRLRDISAMDHGHGEEPAESDAQPAT
ncbi:MULTISPECIES: MFS transporter [unclassified Streptomyces]|uniref:MFS transporter n=1 Tax=unclassified Streptomyces TaxID=2593676 RepID=UPI000932F2B5|nr:MFS transporter [Streptomyces sp. NBRC 110465]